MPVDASEEQLYEAFGKLRRMILMFRSHSKGVLARYCEKIDNRIGKTPLGKTLIEGLMQKGVIYTDNTMYYIEITRFGEVLGAKYRIRGTGTFIQAIRYNISPQNSLFKCSIN